MMARDMFGAEVDLVAMAATPLTGKKKRKPTPKRGHYFKPGTGPDGETCGTCKHLTPPSLRKDLHQMRVKREKLDWWCRLRHPHERCGVQVLGAEMKRGAPEQELQ